MDIDYSSLPEGLRFGMKMYIENHVRTGGFLRAVLSNNLVESFARADENNKAKLFDIVSWVYNEAPGACWGSEATVEAWLNE